MKRGFLIFTLFLIAERAEPAIFIPPELRWFTIETEHFYIHYHSGLEEVAKGASLDFERIDALLRSFIPDIHKGKTHVVLTYFTDLSNGFATPFPQRTIYLFLTPPSPDSSLIYNANWIRTLFIHEYSHIIQLERAGGVPSVVRKIFGRVYFPNIFLPYFFIEGYATWSETRFTATGRHKSSYYEMLLRIAFLAEDVGELEDFSIPFPVRWPFGEIPYLYGSSFIGYVGEVYGEECVEKFNIQYARNAIPFLLNSSMKTACGKTVKELWREWKGFMKSKYEGVRNKVYEEGLMEGRRITRLGRMTRGVRFYSDDELVFASWGMEEYPSINRLSLSTGKIKKISTINYNFFLSVYGGDIYFSDTEFRKGFWELNDIYVIRNDKKKRLTSGLRGFSPEASPQGIWFIKRGPEGSALCNLGEKGKEGECIYTTDGYILSFRFDRSYTRAVLSEQRTGGNIDILLLDISSGRVEELTSDRAVDLYPLFSADGRFVLFSSDRNGIPNIYAKDIITGEEFMVTNLLGGAFEMDISPDGNLIAYVGYTKDGFDIFLMRYDPSLWRKVETMKEEGSTVRERAFPVEVEKKEYAGWRYFYPRFWLPWIYYSGETGLFTQVKTGGTDPLFKHIYMLDGYYQWKIGKGGGSLLFLEDSFYPSIIIRIAELPKRGPVIYTNRVEREFWFRRTLLSASVAVPILKKMRWNLYAGAGYTFYRVSTKREYELYPITYSTGNRSGFHGYIYFDSTKYYPSSFSEEEGLRFMGEAIRYHPDLGSDHSIEEFIAFGEVYEEIGRTVVYGRVDFGKYSGAKKPDLSLSAGSDGDINVRGIKTFPTFHIWALKGEWRIPFLIDRGISTLPIAIRYVYFSPFLHGLFAEEWGRKRWYKDMAVGGEVNTEFYLGYNIPLVFKLGFARGIREKGEYEFYLSFGFPYYLPFHHPLLNAPIPYITGM